MLGSEIDTLDDAELAERAEKTHLFAKLSPLQKARLVRVMREMLGHTVGFMGDGINDAAAMRASDCGISVDSAVDIAKESADIILLQKDLGVLERGIIEGRRTYGNLLQVPQDHGELQLWQCAVRDRREPVLAVLPMSALQLVLRRSSTRSCVSHCRGTPSMTPGPPVRVPGTLRPSRALCSSWAP